MPAATRQAHRLYEVFSVLLRTCQFRDRERVACFGVSISQCYAIEWLADHGPAPMSDLARQMHLDISTMTRAIDQLVRAGMVQRGTDDEDGRVRLVRLTPRGRARVESIRRELVDEHQRVLDHIAPRSREAVIEAVTGLLRAFLRRQSCASAPPSGGRNGDGLRGKRLRAVGGAVR